MQTLNKLSYYFKLFFFSFQVWQLLYKNFSVETSKQAMTMTVILERPCILDQTDTIIFHNMPSSATNWYLIFIPLIYLFI